MKHLGDITKLSGYDVPTVDVVIGGSPCQDLSVAGKQVGLKGERSGLFMEQIRLIKEMREADAARGKTNDAIRPRYMVWENVPGAFSSSQGRDFEAVLEETVRVAEPKAPPVPVPAKGWPTSGCLVGDGWSVAWRVLDAQFWGTPDKPLPQRRRRISLVADFGGRTAPEILFERESVSWHPDESRAATERNPGTPKSNTGNTGGAGMECIQGDDESEPQVITSRVEREVVVDAIPINDKATRFQGGGATRNQDGAGNGLGVGKSGDPSPTLTAADRHIVFTVSALSEKNNCADLHSGKVESEKCDSQRTLTEYAGCLTPWDNQCRRVYDKNGIFPTMSAREKAGQNQQSVLTTAKARGIVRRLTPTECERLQGLPDGWTDIGGWVDSKGKIHSESSDAARYKALGNSIAIPPWKWVLKRLCAIYERDATMASLFDGIGGFPYIWEQLNGKGSCLWASEIEPFPIAVTKHHFGED